MDEEQRGKNPITDYASDSLKLFDKESQALKNGNLLFAALTQIRESGLPIDEVDGVASVK